MKALKLTTSLAALALLFACGSEESPTEPAQTQEPEQGQVQAQAQEQARGVLTTTRNKHLRQQTPLNRVCWMQRESRKKN